MTQEQLLRQVDELFRDDVVASLILDGWKNGMKEREITASLEITRREYGAAVKRINRRVLARWPKGQPYVQ